MITKSTSNIENFLSQKEIKDVLTKIVNIEQQLNQITNSQFTINGTLTQSGLVVTGTAQFPVNSINGSQILDNTISTQKLTDGQITTQKLAAGQVTASRIGNYQVTSDKIQDQSIHSWHIDSNQIQTWHINNNQITSDKIQQLTGDLVFSETVSGKGIHWNNKNNPGTDYQFIKYYQDVSEYSSSYDISSGSNNNGALIIGVEKDLNSTSGEQVIIRTGSRLIIDQNAGNQTTQEPINIVEFWKEGTQMAKIDINGAIYGSKVYNAVWNDLAELRDQETTIEPGYVQFMNEQTGKLTKKYHKYAVGIVSDTYGIILGLDSKSKKIKKGQVPIQISGRVLQHFSGKLKVGDQVCQQKDGTVRKMKWWEKILFPERLIGIVDEIPMYETWGENNVKVNGRIWIKVK